MPYLQFLIDLKCSNFSSPCFNYYYFILRLMEEQRFLAYQTIFRRRSLTRSSIGGDRITDLLAGYLADEFNRKYKADPRETKRGRKWPTSNIEPKIKNATWYQFEIREKLILEIRQRNTAQILVASIFFCIQLQKYVLFWNQRIRNIFLRSSKTDVQCWKRQTYFVDSGHGKLLHRIALRRNRLQLKRHKSKIRQWTS